VRTTLVLTCDTLPSSGKVMQGQMSTATEN
jgi:hypothetical protein